MEDPVQKNTKNYNRTLRITMICIS